MTSSTATATEAREHARAQAGRVAETQPTVPSRNSNSRPEGVDADAMLWEERLGAGGYAARVLPAGSRLRLVDVEGDTCVALLLHRAGNEIERLCLADTVKLQWQVHPRAGYLLLSDAGRVLASIVSDTSGTHDTFTGTSHRLEVEAKFGDGSNSGSTPNGRDRFLLALAKHGLGERDLATPINLFQGVRIDADGAIARRVEPPRPGVEVVLRMEQDVLVSLVVVPHRLDERDAYRAGNVQVTAWRDARASIDDPIRNATPESIRAFENTDEEGAIGGVR